MFIKQQLSVIIILSYLFWTEAWNLSQLKLYADDYVVTDVSNYYIRSFLCIRSRNDSVKLPTLIETIWPENLLLISQKIFPSDLSHTKSLTDCNGIIQAVGTAVDNSTFLWVIDSGSKYCRPKLLVFDLKKNEEIHRHQFNMEHFTSFFSASQISISAGEFSVYVYSIEFFLAKEVTHFVTDKTFNRDGGSSNSSQAHTPKTPLTPFTPYLSESANVGSPNVSSSNESRANSSKPRSRADAMLQKVRDQSCENSFKSTNISSSPVQLAKNWGTPIWSTEHTLRFLEKISATLRSDSTHNTSKGRPANVKHLHGDYIKIESAQRNCRPYFQEIKVWPTINLNSKIGFSPFAAAEPPTNAKTLNNRPPNSNSSSKTNKMTRKSRSKQMRTKNDYKRTSEKQCGYCEVCRLEYDVLSVHLQSKVLDLE